MELESWLGPDEAWLRLYDREGRLRLTPEEAREDAQQAEAAARQAEAEARREAEARAESERRARREAEERLAALEALLRERGIDLQSR